MSSVEKKLVKSKSGYRMVTVDGRIVSPFTIEEPPWTPDFSCTNCQNSECRVKFDFLKRKHHCRRCGRCFCDSCSSTLVELPRMCFIDPVRHCRGCAVISKKENEFFDKHLRTLMDGGKFRIHRDSSIDTTSSDISPRKSLVCSLSVDHRYLQFKGDTHGQENIAVQKIVSVEVTGAEQDQGGNHVHKGVAIQYMNAVGDTVWLEMDVDVSSGDKQQSRNWLTAMLKAFKLINESQSSSP